MKASIFDGHLPEAKFRWVPFGKVEIPNPPPKKEVQTLVRRIYNRPIPMNTRPVRSPRGIHLNGLEHAPVLKVDGPYIISGGWWQREIHREYHFAQTQEGRILWIYFDRRRRRWFLQGSVE